MAHARSTYTRRGLFGLCLGLGLTLVMFIGISWIDTIKGRQAEKLNGTITHRQNFGTSLAEYWSYFWTSDRDHHFRHAYDVMKTKDVQYLWSYRRLRWVPLCSAKPMPCLNDRGSIFNSATYD